ncbi:hypothetical protein PGTUg99_013086 [Puccinia graminis f. sp. tritici]|uniref:Uncharacterized protein n=1 Tax=Puccinia graminis f. sp. tritici TaxID=56615 RepID=A0A5B0LMH7_PUCGR|nr:hypothetical protein PGTUg99_013086 [Puccinia graminis f. sp. tritici]
MGNIAGHTSYITAIVVVQHGRRNHLAYWAYSRNVLNDSYNMSWLVDSCRDWLDSTNLLASLPSAALMKILMPARQCSEFEQCGHSPCG